MICRLVEGAGEGTAINQSGGMMVRKPKFVIWLGVLMALFMGSLGSLDEMCSEDPCERKDPQNAPGWPPDFPPSPSPCSGCSDSPATFGGPRIGHFRVFSASRPDHQAALADTLNDSLTPTFGHAGCLSRWLQSRVLNPLPFLRAVVLLI